MTFLLAILVLTLFAWCYHQHTEARYLRGVVQGLHVRIDVLDDEVWRLRGEVRKGAEDGKVLWMDRAGQVREGMG